MVHPPDAPASSPDPADPAPAGLVPAGTGAPHPRPPAPAPPGPDAAATRRGIFYAGGAFLVWGIAPVYWKALLALPPEEMLAHRVLWSLATLAVVIPLRRRVPELVRAVRTPRVLGVLAVTTALIGVNWYLYIWAMGAERVLEASLGYYINPLVNVLLGVVFLRERLRRGQALAVTLAAAGVAVMTAEVGHVPWLALVLAGTFGFYGLLRKTVDAGPLVGLTVESALLAPLAGLYLARLHAAGDLVFTGLDPWTMLLVAAAGAVTVVPLVWFTHGARLLPLSALGLLQYLAPTLQFLLAILVYGEPFTRSHLAAFVLIWIGLAVFTADLRRRTR
ncbi:MAG TPA: EamA family transporter RarD [Thermoanaerobaculia bacterium]|nr:EamA family transporter RarD [Thermoanaerobaculia bacterium]